jgi:hypothetical protein
MAPIVRFSAPLDSGFEQVSFGGVLTLEIRQPAGDARNKSAHAAANNYAKRLLKRETTTVQRRILSKEHAFRWRAEITQPLREAFGSMVDRREEVRLAPIEIRKMGQRGTNLSAAPRSGEKLQIAFATCGSNKRAD